MAAFSCDFSVDRYQLHLQCGIKYHCYHIFSMIKAIIFNFYLKYANIRPLQRLYMCECGDGCFQLRLQCGSIGTILRLCIWKVRTQNTKTLLLTAHLLLACRLGWIKNYFRENWLCAIVLFLLFFVRQIYIKMKHAYSLSFSLSFPKEIRGKKYNN